MTVSRIEPPREPCRPRVFALRPAITGISAGGQMRIFAPGRVDFHTLEFRFQEDPTPGQAVPRRPEGPDDAHPHDRLAVALGPENQGEPAESRLCCRRQAGLDRPFQPQREDVGAAMMSALSERSWRYCDSCGRAAAMRVASSNEPVKAS